MTPGGVTIPGGKPVTARPGATPRFPFTTVTPVLVTVEAPRTVKLLAVPKMSSARALKVQNGATNKPKAKILTWQAYPSFRENNRRSSIPRLHFQVVCTSDGTGLEPCVQNL